MDKSAAAMNNYDIGKRLSELCIGIDRFERTVNSGEGPLSSEGLVPIFLGQDMIVPKQLAHWDEVFADLDELEQASRLLAPGARRSFLLSMIDSLRAASELFAGKTLSFKDKLERLVGVPAGAVPEEQVAALRENLEASLAQLGYRQGSVAERVARWEADGRVDVNKLNTVFEDLMRDAQARTDARIYDTGDYSMQLNLVSDVPYTARCKFDDGLMDLNADLQFSRSALKHLVAHEVFPGHSTQLLYTLEAAKTGQSPVDVLLCTTNAATGAIQEGIGDQGIHLIDWVDSEDDALHLNLRRLRSAAATSAAWYLMAEGWAEERVRDYLTETAFPQKAWLEGRLRFAAHPFRGPFIASYWFGDEAVREVREHLAADKFPAFIRELYGQMNTPDTLRMFN